MQLSTGDLIEDLQRWQRFYLRSLKALSYSENSIELYERTIDFFIEYMREFQDDIDIKDITQTYFTDFLAFLDEKAKRHKTIKNKLQLEKSTKITYIKGLKNFFLYISDNNSDLFSYERFFRKLKIADSSRPEEKIRYLSEERVQKLLAYIKKKLLAKRTYNGHRDALLLKLLLYSGLRISEALNVRLENFITDRDDSSMYAIEIIGKGGKKQRAKILKKAVDEELYFLEKYGDLSSYDYLMKTNSGKILRRDNAYKIVSGHYKRAGFLQQGLHILRHTMAMRLTERDTDPLIIKEAMRHSSINSTTVYAKASGKRVNSALKDIQSE